MGGKFYIHANILELFSPFRLTSVERLEFSGSTSGGPEIQDNVSPSCPEQVLSKEGEEEEEKKK